MCITYLFYHVAHKHRRAVEQLEEDWYEFLEEVAV